MAYCYLCNQHMNNKWICDACVAACHCNDLEQDTDEAANRKFGTWIWWEKLPSRRAPVDIIPDAVIERYPGCIVAQDKDFAVDAGL
jgi:hypothetical protein